MKRTATKILSLMLAAAMAGGVVWFVPDKVLAEGSSTEDRTKEKDFCYIGLDCESTPAGFPEEGYLYRYSPWDEPKEINVAWDGASYDPDSNTLTLKNFNHPDVGFIFDGVGYYNCGCDLKILLIGDNHIQRIDDGFSGLDFQGSGSLTVNENKKAYGSTVSFNNSYYEDDDHLTQFHVGNDATVIIYRSPDKKIENNDYIIKGYCITVSGYDKETQKPEDYLTYDGDVTPEIEWEEEEVSPAGVEYLSLTDKLYVKTEYPVSRVFADKNDADAIRLLVEGKVEDSNETYAWVEKHNGKWFVSRSSWYDTGISGEYEGILADDLKSGEDKITAYANAAATIDYSTYIDSFYAYTKNDKYYAIVPKALIIDKWDLTDLKTEASVFCMGEITQSTPMFYLNSEPYDAWTMDSYTVVDGVSTGKEADKYMTDNGYTKIIASSWNAWYNLNTLNDVLKFSPKANPTDTPTPTTKPTDIPTPTTKPATPTPTAVPKSTWKQEGKSWYYYDANGTKVTGWQEISKVWYFFDSNGVMQTGWIESGGKWYFMKDTGAMQTGWIQLGGKWYLLGSSGAMATGWVEDGGKWYYLSPSGAMATGWVKLGGKWYFLSASGAMATGWVQSGGKWYYMSPSGAMVENGWAKSGNSWYYFDGNGVMVTGEYKTDGKMSKFSDSGAWIGYI